MTTRSGKLRGMPLLPEGVGDRLRRISLEVLGLAIAVLALLAFAALVSYDPADPSWNTATHNPPVNWLGRPGAWAADLGVQLFGAASVFFTAVFFTWGWRLWRYHSLSGFGIRLAGCLAFLLLMPACLALTLPVAQWPTHSGAGGLVGALLSAWATHMATELEVSGALMIVPAALLTAGAALAALGLSRAEWQQLGASIGGTLPQAAARPGRRKTGAAARRVEPPPLDSPATARGGPATRRPAENTGQRTKPPAEPAPRPIAEREVYADEDNGGFCLPPLDLLAEPESDQSVTSSQDTLDENARALEGVLNDFGVRGQILRARQGPVVTRYELEPAPGTRAARVVGLADDIARSMSAVSARVAVIAGRNAIGIELPNERREIVFLRELLNAPEYSRVGTALPLVLGKDISGSPVVTDLGRMPHLLIAGTTGSGKSVAVNCMILSLLYRLSPEECRMIMIDPKMLELSVYDDIPHLLHPVVIDPAKAVVALKWAVKEMNARYRLMSNLNVRNIAGYNKRVRDALARGEMLTRTVQTGFDAETGRPTYESQPLEMTPLPFIVVVVDEMADLMLVAGKDIEVAIQSLAQKARAAGIHLIIATQRPSVDVITGTIKANLPTRISFQVTSRIDSRTILGEHGAEQLLGMGDMLYMAGGGKVARVHGPFVSDEEVEEVANFLRGQGMPDYLDSITEGSDDEPAAGGRMQDSGDELFDQAVALVARERKVSTSFIQRHLSIGYNRAAKIVERMEAEGMVGKANHVGKREVLLPEASDDG